MSNLVKQTEQYGYRARADRSIQSGRVVSVDKVTHTATLDVGMIDFAGNPVYMVDVPYSPQAIPHVQDIVAILRTNSSPYSHIVGSGAQVGGANSGQIVEAGGAVTSVKNTGDASGQQGDLTVNSGTDITITRAGKTFTFSLADCTKTSAKFGAFADLCARLDSLEALVAGGTIGGGAIYSYDFSVAANSMYAALGAF